MTNASKEQKIRKALEDLHSSYLRSNEYDEGDPIFYRISYRLEEAFGLSRQEAADLHEMYHKKNPRRTSEGFCEKCGKVVGIIPIIYGILESDLKKMKEAENENRLIIGDLNGTMRQKPSMFGCKICKTALPKCGTL